ncbi:MAG: pantothenate kinase [Symploca sp. SIO1C2]|nr:pantothenate kinase [Symploca sp. SIO1C2]
MIGNSRLHWALFVDGTLTEAWDTNHLSATAVEQLLQDWASGIMPAAILSSVSWKTNPSQLPLYIASVVPAQTKLWQTYPAAQVITLADLPLQGIYPTLGIDRALAVLGAGETYGYPVLMIDAGTALTFTGANAQRQLIGGAILPGLGLQLKSLAQKTAALPTTQLPSQLPTRWAMETPGAIESGVIYTVLAGIQDFIANWQQQFPDSQIALTGGDSDLLLKYLQAQFPEIAAQIVVDTNLIFRGIRELGIGNWELGNRNYSSRQDG